MLLLAVLACNNPADEPRTKAEQCRALLDVIDAEEKRGGKSDSMDPNDLLKSATAVAQAGASAAGVKLDDEGLVELRRRYANMVADLSLTSRDAAFALAKKDGEAIARTTARLDTSRAVEANLRRDLATYCAAP